MTIGTNLLKNIAEERNTPKNTLFLQKICNRVGIMKELMEKIRNETACVGIVGLGYVGLPLAIAFSKKFNTVGYDVYDKCIENLLSGKSHILDILDSNSPNLPWK